MAKKFIAALLALTMCAGLAGCGNKNDKKDSSTSKASANTSAADTDAANDENTADSKADDGSITVTAKLNKDNIILDDINCTSTVTPTNDELLAFVELAVEQYRAIQTNDNEKLKQTLAFHKVIDPFCEIVRNTDIDITGLFLGDVDDDDLSLKDKEIITWGMMISMCSDIDEADTDKADEYNALGDDLNKRMNFVIDNLDFGEFSDLFWNKEDLVPMSELNSDTIIGVDLRNFERDGDDMFIIFDLAILSGNDMFEFVNVNAWYMDGDSGIMISRADHNDNKYAGMTIDEIKQKVNEDNAAYYSRAAARTLYNSMANYCADQKAAGEDIKKKLESDFPMCTSSDGLDLAGDEPEADGDKYVYAEMHEAGYTDGKAFISGYDEEIELIEMTAYTSADGVSEYYHPIKE